jgi:Rha family phage regulatory protein
MESIQGNIELTIVKGKAITTSRQIALHFNKLHKNVVRDIRNLDCSPQFNVLNFERVDYKDDKGEARKEYQITRNGFMYVAMGFTGKRAAEFKEAYIQAFNEMEYKLYMQSKTVLQKESLMLSDLYSMGSCLENTLVNVAHTKGGEIVGISPFEQPSDPVIIKEEPTVLYKSSWIQIVEMFFDEIESDGIPEKMRQNILLSKEITSINEQHDCLFFRLSNLMAFFRKTPRFTDLMNKSTIRTASMLLKQLNDAGVLAFDGKEKEKGISMNPSIPSDINVRRVSHLVAIDLVVLKRDYAIVMSSHRGIARAFH